MARANRLYVRGNRKVSTALSGVGQTTTISLAYSASSSWPVGSAQCEPPRQFAAPEHVTQSIEEQGIGERLPVLTIAMSISWLGRSPSVYDNASRYTGIHHSEGSVVAPIGPCVLIQRRLWVDRHCSLRRPHHLPNGCDRRLGVIAVEGQRHMACSGDDTMDPNG